MVTIRPADNDTDALLELRCALDHETKFMLAEPGERQEELPRLSYRLVADDEGLLVGVIDVLMLPWRRVRGRGSGGRVPGGTRSFCAGTPARVRHSCAGSGWRRAKPMS